MMEGIYTALWTPTDKQGVLLKEAVKKHLDHLLESGVTGIVVAGSTGQFPYLDLSVRLELLHLVIAHVGAERVFVNISDYRPDVAKSFASEVSKTNVAAIMLLPPFFYPFAPVDIAAYISYLARLAKRPLILYNFPECARNKIEPDTIESLAKELPLAGIKHSGSDFDYHTCLVDLGTKHGFTLFTGHDSRLLEALTLGCGGSIGGLSNGIPELIVALYRAFKEKRLADAEATGKKISAIYTLLKSLTFPLNIAALMEARGFSSGAFKEILSPQTFATFASVVESVKSQLQK